MGSTSIFALNQWRPLSVGGAGLGYGGLAHPALNLGTEFAYRVGQTVNTPIDVDRSQNLLSLTRFQLLIKLKKSCTEKEFLFLE
jgi:hypothetical protein